LAFARGLERPGRTSARRASCEEVKRSGHRDEQVPGKRTGAPQKLSASKYSIAVAHPGDERYQHGGCGVPIDGGELYSGSPAPGRDSDVSRSVRPPWFDGEHLPPVMSPLEHHKPADDGECADYHALDR
jgi:hypothetical protein